MINRKVEAMSSLGAGAIIIILPWALYVGLFGIKCSLQVERQIINKIHKLATDGGVIIAYKKKTPEVAIKIAYSKKLKSWCINPAVHTGDLYIDSIVNSLMDEKIPRFISEEDLLYFWRYGWIHGISVEG